MEALRAEAVGDWQACGPDCFYARELLHDMQWQDMELEGKRVRCAPFGGPIALVRDERQMVMVRSDSIQPVVRLFTATGAALGSFVWDSAGSLLAWGWTPQLQLACVEPRGMVVLRGLTGEKLREFSLGQAVAASGLAAAHLEGPALVAITHAGGWWVVPDVTSPRPQQLPPPPIAAELMAGCCMALLPPHRNISGNLEVLVAGGGVSGVVYQLGLDGCQEYPLGLHPPSPVLLMRLSPCGGFLALFTADARLLVMESDLSRQLSEFETHADTPPSSVEWVGSDAVLLQWHHLLLVVGPHGDHVSWSTDSRVVLVPELDGVRLISSSKQELLRKVPASLMQVFRPGSTDPSTQLWDARSLLDAGNARCDKLLRALGPQLARAVTTCMEAAVAELSVPRQQALMRAAAYGRAFVGPSFPPHALSVAAHTLRLLNSLQDPTVGLPLTAPQLHALGIPAVLARLVLYRQWLLAYRIAGSLTWAPPQLLAIGSSTAPSNLPGATAQETGISLAGSETAGPSSALTPSHLGTLDAAGRAGRGGQQVSPAALQEAVLSAWACARISAAARGAGGAVADAELKDQLMAKLSRCPTVRYAPLAAHAQEVGRRRLALLLLEEETSCALQVPLLLSLAAGRSSDKASGRAGAISPDGGEGEGGEVEDALSRALRRAIESGDTDLVLHVLFTAYRTRPLPAFWSLVNSRALARNLFVKFCRAREPELLETLLTTSSQTVELAHLKLGMSLAAWKDARARRLPPPDPTLTSLLAGLAGAASKYATSRDHMWQSKAVTDLASLRREQARLERETGQTLLLGLSLEATLQQLIRLGHHKHAAALRKQFSVGDRHWWWLKIRVLAEARDWDALDAFAAEKKSPVGYEPFLEVGKLYGAPRDVLARLISRLPDTAAKADAYAAIDQAREAAEVAARLKDSALLSRISSAVSAASPAGLAIAQIKERFFATAGGGGAGRS